MRILTKTQTLIVFDMEMDNCDGMSVADLKIQLQNFPGINLLADEQCLRYGGIFLNDEMLLNDIFGEKREIFYLTRLNNIEPNDEDGAVGGDLITTTTTSSKTTTTKLNDETDRCSILTESDFQKLSNISGLYLLTDDDDDDNDNKDSNDKNNERNDDVDRDGDVNMIYLNKNENIIDNDDENDGATTTATNCGGIFDEDMELPPDLQQYYQENINVNKDLTNKLVAMGYQENDVKNALQASFNDPERAVEYLIDGLPNLQAIFLNSSNNDCEKIDNSHTPPPSYAGSICSDYSMAPMPPSPHSPEDINSTTNLFSKPSVTSQYQMDISEDNDICENNGENTEKDISNNNNAEDTENNIDNNNENLNSKNDNDNENNTGINNDNNTGINNENNPDNITTKNTTVTEAYKNARNENPNTSSESERQGYDANDEADGTANFQLGKRKRKMPTRYKKRRIEIWAAKATLATALQNHQQQQQQHQQHPNQNQSQTSESKSDENQLIEQMTITSISDIPISITRPVTPTQMDIVELPIIEESTTEDANSAGGDHNDKTNSKI